MNHKRRQEEPEMIVKMAIQKLIGVGMLLLSVWIFIEASHAQVKGDLDATPLAITVPIGLGLLISKSYHLNI